MRFEWLLAVVQVGTLVVLVWQAALLKRQWSVLRDQMAAQQFAEYTRRYAEIVRDLPEAINDAGFELDRLPHPQREPLMRLMRGYFNLCFEEWQLAQLKWVDDRVWSQWSRGIAAAMRRPAFIAAWETVRESERHEPGFVGFMNELSRRRPPVRYGLLTKRVLERAGSNADGSPRTQATADDWERLFAWAESHDQFTRFLPRLAARPRERDAAISEIRVASLLESLGAAVTTWEPKETSRPGEFEVKWPASAPIFVEVKHPTWESELDPSEREARKGLPKLLEGEGRWIDQRVEVRYAAQKTMGKLPPGRPCLLVVDDNLFRPAADDLEPGDLATVLDDPAFDGLGGILCVNSQFMKDDESGVDLRTRFEVNPRAAKTLWEIPGEAVAALTGSPFAS